MGREGFEPSKAGPADLQSALVDRLSISPKKTIPDPLLDLVKKKSLQLDSNQRPADYKSAALAN